MRSQLTLAAILTTGSLALHTEAAEPPNVLFISIDDLNDWVGCLKGHPQARTPNIDRLASQGVLFTRAYCPAPSCCPSRTALMTGIARQDSGVYGNNQVWRQALPDAVTIPQHFRANGYYAAGAGKIFHHGQNDPASWDDYWPSKIAQFPAYKKPKDQDRSKFPRWENIYVSFDWGPIDATDEQTGDFQSVKYVLGQLEKKHVKPFFLTCGIYRPHVPWYVPRKYFDMFPLDEIQLPPMYEQDLDDLPPYARRMVQNREYYAKMIEYDQQPRTVQAYLASVAYMDAMVGQLLDGLRKSRYADNTIVVLWSDHGWQLGEKHHYRKFALWEDIARVPLIFSGPGIPRGKTCGRTVNLLDLYPTLIELCGLPTRKGLGGRSLSPLLENAEADWPHASVTTYEPGSASVRTERWRYIRYSDGGDELYDHRHDPNEWANLADTSAYTPVKERLRAMLPSEYKPKVKTEVPEQWSRRRREAARGGGG